jgi:prephenate dehydratase
VLRPFADAGIQLTKLESRPSRTEILEYVFLCDFLGHRDDPIIAKALSAVAEECTMLKVFGSYPRFPLEKLTFGSTGDRS